MRPGDGAGQFGFHPAALWKRTRGTPAGRKNFPGIFHQPEWRDVHLAGQKVLAWPSLDAGGRRRGFTFAHSKAGEHVKKPAAIEADDGLHGAVDAGVSAANNARLVSAVRTLKMKCSAHVF